MSIPESVIEAAYDQGDEFFVDDAEARAKRVILALAEDMPEDAVDKAISGWLDDEKGWSPDEREEMRPGIIRAIADFLKHVAGDSP